VEVHDGLAGSASSCPRNINLARPGLPRPAPCSPSLVIVALRSRGRRCCLFVRQVGCPPLRVSAASGDGLRAGRGAVLALRGRCLAPRRRPRRQNPSSDGYYLKGFTRVSSLADSGRKRVADADYLYLISAQDAQVLVLMAIAGLHWSVVVSKVWHFSNRMPHAKGRGPKLCVVTHPMKLCVVLRSRC